MHESVWLSTSQGKLWTGNGKKLTRMTRFTAIMYGEIKKIYILHHQNKI